MEALVGLLNPYIGKYHALCIPDRGNIVVVLCNQRDLHLPAATQPLPTSPGHRFLHVRHGSKSQTLFSPIT